MMIEVEHLTKWYGRTLALDRISFGVAQGQIVGFLGPNGAGKTTTLRILTGYLPATSGSARVAGRDVLLESLAVRSLIGYMPENMPLYPEMRVEEYLRLRAGLKGVPSARRGAAVDRAVERCWLKDVRRRLIGQLSKGYRQRVGLAEALVADPPVLILDEPTIGLDPAQIQETRRLIRALGEAHTVLLSSHILPEVEKTCSHLVIIAEGRIAAAGSIEELTTGLTSRRQVILEVRPGAAADGPAEMARAVGRLAGVTDVRHEPTADGWTRLAVTPSGETDVRDRLHALVVQRGWLLRELRAQAATLEELYVQMTAGEAAARSVA
ncbi:MAG TPA: ABC transporter ATP-binding protein [Phycisphaerae bacterium]|nr:ABC transporter ATP-binding protein [Phycisphaerae bacterium]